MSRRNKKRRPARSSAQKLAKIRILVVTEGAVTEPEYLKGFAEANKNLLVWIGIETGAGVPKTIVESAKNFESVLELSTTILAASEEAAWAIAKAKALALKVVSSSLAMLSTLETPYLLKSSAFSH